MRGESKEKSEHGQFQTDPEWAVSANIWRIGNTFWIRGYYVKIYPFWIYAVSLQFVFVSSADGIPIDEAFALKFKGMSCHNKLEKGKAQSCADAMAIAIQKDIALYEESQPEQLNIDNGQEDKDEDHTDNSRGWGHS